MNLHTAVEAELSVPDFRVELLAQESSGPFRRTHRLPYPALCYLPAVGGEPARGCLGEPLSHRSFRQFGSAVVVPPHTPIHVISPGFGERRMLICRFESSRFEITGLGARRGDPALEACIDIRDAAVLTTLERLSIELVRPARSRETIIAGLGLVLLGELTRHFEQVRSHDGRSTGMLAPWQMKRIDTRLADESRPAPGVDELAALCGISRRHLMRAFKAATSLTVMEHVERTLFTRAAALLAETQMPLKSLARSLGYERQGSFSAAFRRRFGETPRDYLARARGRRASVN